MLVIGVRMVRLVRFERTLHALSTHSLCRLGYRRLEEVEDQVGFKPTRGRARPLKRRLPSIAWLLVREWRTPMVKNSHIGGHGGTRTHVEALARQPG